MPTEEMLDRYDTKLKSTIPSIDYLDKGKNRQFCPENAQSTHLTMLTNEKAIGQYLRSSCLDVRPD